MTLQATKNTDTFNVVLLIFVVVCVLLASGADTFRAGQVAKGE